jgi:hypothetical protein
MNLSTVKNAVDKAVEAIQAAVNITAKPNPQQARTTAKRKKATPKPRRRPS